MYFLINNLPHFIKIVIMNIVRLKDLEIVAIIMYPIGYIMRKCYNPFDFIFLLDIMGPDVI